MSGLRPMRLNRRRKRLVLRLAEPVLRSFYLLYRLLTLELFADHRLPVDGGPEPERILVVRLDSIGDVLLSEPAIAALHQRFPKARLDVVVAPEGKAILQNNACVDSFAVCKVPWYSAWRGERVSWLKALAEVLGLVRRLRRERYDIAIELRGDIRDILFAVLAGARIRVGNGWRGGGFLLDRDVPLDRNLHRVDFALGIVAAVGAGGEGRSPKICLAEAERERAHDLLPLDPPAYVAFHLGSGFPSKCLPVEKFVEAANALSGRGRRPVLVGGPGEKDLAEGYLRHFTSECIDLVGKLGLIELAAVLERCALFIGNDSGPMHISAAMGTPIVAVFGPSDPRVFGPHGVEHKIVAVDLPCRPCDHVHCVHKEYVCMTSIRAEDIVAAAEELLAKPGPPPGPRTGQAPALRLPAFVIRQAES